MGPFAELLRQIRHDPTALDALAFAYGALDEPGRRALIHALLQDAEHPTQGLGAFLAVERDPELRRHLARLISEQGPLERSAVLQGDAARGEARLIQSLPGFWPEALRVRWSRSKIECIEIEVRAHLRIEPPASAPGIAEVVDALAPMVWRHIREGGGLPQGVGRFAGFFSLA